MFQAWLVKMGKDGGEFGAEDLAGKQAEEEDDGEGEEAEDRDGLQDVEHGDEDEPGAAAFGGPGGVGEGEEEGADQGREHAQGGADGVVREVCRGRG